MFRDVPAHCGTNATSMPSARGKKKRKVSDTDEDGVAEGAPLSAQELLDKTADARFVCADLTAAEGLGNVALSLKASKESFWDAYVDFVAWLDDRGDTDEAIVRADASVYANEPATPRAGGAASSSASTAATPAQPGSAGGAADGSAGMVTATGSGGQGAVAGSAGGLGTPTPSVARPLLGLYRSSAGRRM